MKKIKVIMLALLLAAVSSYAIAPYVNETFEGYTTGTNPPCTYSTPGVTNNGLVDAHVWVVGSSPINKGQAIELVDNNITTGVRYEQGVLNATTGTLSSLRYDFTFSPLRTDGSSEQYINAGVTTNGGNTGSSAQRFVVIRLYPDGKARFQAGSAPNAVGPYITYASGSVHKVSMYLNDGSSAITYTDPLNTSTNNVLAANDAAFYFDDVFVTNGALQGAGTGLSSSTNGLGKVGFGCTTAASNIFYAIDNVKVTDVNYVSPTEYSLTVNNGTGSSTFEYGTVVPIVANSNPNKTFLAWIGDTATVANTNNASTTVTMPSNAVTVTATYNKGLLTVNNGTAADNGTYLTNGAQRTITANAPGANQTFARWIGDVSTVANVYSQTTTVTIAGLDVALTASYAGFSHDYEDEATLGVAPTNGSPLMITQYPPTNGIWVVSGTTNTAGTGQAVELKDDSVNGMGFEYNITGAGDSGISAARASFAFSWKNLGATAGAQMAASFGEYASSRSMSSSAGRWTEARLNDNGTVTLSANQGTPSPDTAIQLLADTANTLNVFANDYDSQSVNYKVNGTTYTLTPNSVAYWMNGQLVTVSNGFQGVAMDLTEVPVAGGTIETTENNLGKFGFSSGSGTVGIDYIIDNIMAKALPATPEELYALVVNFGGSGGLYTNGQQVVIKAHTNAAKNFIKWNGGSTYLANSNSATTTVTMPAAGLTLTAIYNVNVLTVSNGTTSGSYTNGVLVPIIASNAPANQVFVQWSGTGLPYVTNAFTPYSAVLMPPQDITVYPVYAGILNGFEGDSVGAAPTVGSPIVSTNVLVVASGANTAGTGQAVEYIDNDLLVAAGLEYNIANGKPALSAAKASFAFSWKDVGGTNGDQIAASFGEYSSLSSKQLGSAARRWTEARLCNDGTVDFAASYVAGSVTNSFSNNNNPLVENMKNTLTIFANDYDSTAVNYTVNGATYGLPANSVAYWLNGRVITFGVTNNYAPMDRSDLNLAGDEIGASEGNLGKFGFSSTSTAGELDYILDDIAVSANKPWDALYALRVIGGDNGGLYTNSQQVTITANPVAGRTFKSWSGDLYGNVANTNVSPATVTMPASGTNGVTLTAIYDNVVLTLNGGIAGGSGTSIETNTVGSTIVITASDTRPGVTFKEWAGTATQYVANATASPTTVTLPPQDINLAARYYYYLTITNGSGSGNYTNNATVVIVASNLVGKTFDQWTGDIQLVDNVTNASATVTMSTNPATLTAEYVNTPYTLTVNLGSGDGTNYIYGQVVPIVADPPDSGLVFIQWTGSGAAYVANVFATNTTVTMPAANITVNATYGSAAVELKGLGSTGGSVTPSSTNVAIGGSQAFTVTASNFFRITGVFTNGANIGVAFNNASTSYVYTRTNVQMTGTVSATFAAQVTTNPAASGANVPYSWLAGYGLNNYEADSVLDQDNDGMKTWQEYVAGTVPTNAASVLKGAQATRNIVTWNAVTGRVYSVYWSTNLVKGFAQKVDNLTYPTNNATASYTNATPDSRVNHYQIKVRLP